MFVRLTGCNLRCTWCDTPYTSWEPQGEEMTIAEILARVQATGAQHVVVTGGEPMLFPEVVDLTRELTQLGLHITIETAGTVDQPVECDLMSISPKLGNSTPRERDGGRWATQHARLRFQPVVLKRLIRDYEYQLKFVVSQPGDLKELNAICSAIGAARDRVLLMPEGITPEVLRERATWLVDVCKSEGFRYSPRLHIELWGNRRGV